MEIPPHIMKYIDIWGKLNEIDGKMFHGEN